MSKASNYREDLMFDAKTKPPMFEDSDRRYEARVTVEGVYIAAWLYQDEALRLRDWLTEVFEGGE